MTEDRESLIEQVVSAFRDRDPFGVVQWAPAWHDLDADDRRGAFDQTLLQRELEAAADPQGLSSTARAVWARIRDAP